MYKSPIELLVMDIQNQIMKQQDEEIYQAVLHYIPNVDKAELIRALKYDRDQYEKGYRDGKADAMESLVRCKDCEHYEEQEMRCDHPEQYAEYCSDCFLCVSQDDFCSYGERRTDAEET